MVEKTVPDSGNRPARIGMVHYINTAPIHEPWKERNSQSDWQLIEDHPAALNRMLAAGEIDLGFVSSHEYGIRPEQYRILSDLSISANGPVGSVFLFSRVKPSRLDQAKVLLSAQSRTSVCLVRVVLEYFYGVSPWYLTGTISPESIANSQAVLAIGDEALRLKHRGSYPYCLDLGEVWQEHTSLPFVFAVCAVRESFCRQQPALVAEIHRELLICKDIGIRELPRICGLAAPRIPMREDDCQAYLQAIEYDLDDLKQAALTTFFTYLTKFNEASEGAVPLKIEPLEQIASPNT